EDREPENTGRRFQGPIFGDYVRTAIGSRLNTGSVFGTGSMLALSTISPKFCQRFSFHSDAGCETYDLDKFLETARIMMARRDMNMSNAEEEALRSLHEQCT
ncbi:MAG: hypothetical protein MI741_23445, partial [Rhodospirillales bacterium]|nr:hypothetical protein [Rhodospirillales bacterium]